jgi:hypothetical protein
VSPRGFDHIMLDHEAGRNLKLASFTAAEKCAWVFGVLPIAGKARMRGAFMVGNAPATAAHVAAQSGETKKTAASLISKMRSLGMLEHDPDIDAEWVHDFQDHNPAPKKDTTAAERARRYRENQKARHGNVTASSHRDDCDDHGDVTPTEEKRREEKRRAPLPPAGGAWPGPPTKPSGGRARQREQFERDVADYAAWLVPDVPEPHRSQLARSAIGNRCSTNEDVAAYVRRWGLESAGEAA